MSKNFLYIAFRFPYPQTDGYKLRVFNYCKLLKELGYNIDLLFIYENENEYLEYISEANNIYRNIYPIKLTKLEKLKNLMLSILKNQSLQENIYITKKGREKIKKLGQQEYDFYLSSYIRMFKYVLSVPKEKRIIDFTDSISYHYDEARKLSKGIWNFIHRYEFLKVKKFEHFILDNCDKRMITSPLDREYILRDYTDKNTKIHIFSQGINEELLKRNVVKSRFGIKKIVFLGKMNYYPNEDAMINFCKNILPHLKKVELKIVGTSPSKKIIELEQKYKNVKVTGFLKDPYEEVLNADLMIAPMRLGGGVQNKILEGMALGKCVVSYQDRIESIYGIKNYENIIGVKNDSEMIKVLNDDEIDFNQIGIKAKEVIQDNYLWNSIKYKLKKLIE